jgi:hypothetical protein
MRTAIVTFGKAKLKRFKVAYERAVKDKDETFIFDGQEYATNYAKQLIAYLQTKL